MREIRPSGLEGGVGFHSSSLPLSREARVFPGIFPARVSRGFRTVTRSLTQSQSCAENSMKWHREPEVGAMECFHFGEQFRGGFPFTFYSQPETLEDSTI